MKSYYLKDGSREKGPFMLDDLKYQRIRSTTMVKEDNGPWTLISENSDLSFLLQMDNDSNTYAGNSVSANTSNYQKPKTNPMIMMVILAAFIAVLGAMFAFFFAAG